MRIIKNLLIILLMALLVTSCNNKETKVARIEAVNVQKPDMTKISVKGENYGSIVNNTLDDAVEIAVESDFIKPKNDCQLVNSRILLTDTRNGQELLYASADLHLNGCESEYTNTNNDEDCQGFLKNGNYVFKNRESSVECVYDIFMSNQQVYQQYLDSMEQLNNTL